MQDNLKSVCTLAMQEGQKIDLTGCNYGETTGPCRVLKRPTNYYYFLAGLVRSQRMTRILEIGTHFGGAIMSMSRGLNKENIPQSKLVTVDIEHKNQDGFKEYPHIERITGDSLSRNVIKKVGEHFDKPAASPRGEPVDLIYIDSLHEYDHTRKNIDIYAKSLNPRYIALDDIRQCDSMVKLWGAITQEFKENAFDASEISIRKGAGFGIIKWS
jgi:cephalosporin hydroxylase